MDGESRVIWPDGYPVGRERHGMNWPRIGECLKTIQMPRLGSAVQIFKTKGVTSFKTE